MDYLCSLYLWKDEEKSLIVGLVKVKIESIIKSDECVSELKNLKFCEGI